VDILKETRKDVIIGRLEADMNDITRTKYGINQFPILALFMPNSKRIVGVYQGNRQAVDIANWINQNCPKIEIKEDEEKTDNKEEKNDKNESLEIDMETINKKNELTSKNEFIKEKFFEIKKRLDEIDKKIENITNTKEKDLKNKEKKYKDDLKQKENENLLIINQFNELKEEFENENNKEKEVLLSNNKMNLSFKNLSIDEIISVYLISSNNKNEDKTNLLNEERNILITKSRKSETNSSTNHFNKINLNSNINTYSNNLNENILNNYLNTINVGYTGLNENYKINIDNEENLIVNDNAIECEPTPSFIVCIKKMNNI
jgi:hypothetical protein